MFCHINDENFMLSKEELLKRVEINPDIMAGKPIIKGTRIPVELILNLLGQQLSIKDILDDYPHLKKEDIQAALFYASSVIHNEEIIPLAANQ